MALRDFWQDRPAPLVWAWEATAWALKRVRPVFEKLGMERSSKLVKVPEEMVKGLLFNCQDCAQCVLHYTGMTCPMNCPKHLRNGPCGGVRPNGHCEVKPEMRCVWVVAYENAQQMPIYGHELHEIQPPVNRQLEHSSAWVNMLTGADKQVPAGWAPLEDVPG